MPPARKKEKSKDDTKEKVVRASIPAKPLNLTPRLSGPAPIDPPAPPATLRYASAAAAGTQKSNEQNDLNAIDKLTEQLSTTNVKAKKESTTIQSRPNSIEKPDLPPLEKDISELFATPELIETFKTMQNGINIFK